MISRQYEGIEDRFFFPKWLDFKLRSEVPHNLLWQVHNESAKEMARDVRFTPTFKFHTKNSFGVDAYKTSEKDLLSQGATLHGTSEEETQQ